MSQKHAIYIGRFRPLHHGHYSAIIQAFTELELDKLTILVGSSNRHRSPKNPFTFDEVRIMIENSLPEYADKIEVKPLFDHAKNCNWQADVRSKSVGATHIIGHNKDESSYYLNLFPELKQFECEPVYIGHVKLSATLIRELLFNDKLFDNPCAALTPLGTYNFLKEWVKTEFFDEMLAETKSAEREVAKFVDYPYKDHLNIACADNVVTCAGHVLLTRRKFNPGKNCLAIPGGHKSEHETFLDAALRELHEETKIKLPENVLRGSIVGEKMFDDPRRSYPHTRITMAYHIDVKPNPNGSLPRVTAADDAVWAGWVSLHELNDLQSEMYDDHYQIIQHFVG